MCSQPNTSAFFVLSEEYLERERRAEYKSKYFAGEIVAMAGAKRKHTLICGSITTSSAGGTVHKTGGRHLAAGGDSGRRHGSLEAIVCTLALDDICRKAEMEPARWIVSDKPR